MPSLTPSGWMWIQGGCFLPSSLSLSYSLHLRVNIAIGPYEVKEDTFAGLKAAYEAFVYVTDQTFEFTSSRLRTLLPDSQVNPLQMSP